MGNKIFAVFLLLLTVFSACPVVFGETYHLSGNDWKKVSGSPDGAYILAVSKIKRYIAEGNEKEVKNQLKALKKDFPEIVGEDLEAFMCAELLFTQKKYIKASRKYMEFLDDFPDSRFYESALERQYSIANAFIKGQKRPVLGIFRLSAYEEADNIMHDIADRAGDAPIAKRALTTLAMGYQKRKKYMEAYDVWAEISSLWPTGDLGRDALLEMGHSLHSAYKGPKYDSTVLISARTYYEDFAARYPLDLKKYDINAKIKLIDEQLAFKEYQTGQYYTRAELPESAEIYYESTAQKWPDTTAAMISNDILDGNVPEAEKKTAERKFFDSMCVFLDTWFGAGLVF